MFYSKNANFICLTQMNSYDAFRTYNTKIYWIMSKVPHLYTKDTWKGQKNINGSNSKLLIFGGKM